MAAIKKDGVEIQQSTCCMQSRFANMELYCPNLIPMGRISYARLVLNWTTTDVNETILRFISQPTGGHARFDSGGGLTERKFPGSFDGYVAIYGERESGDDDDLRLEIVIRDRARLSVEVRVKSEPAQQERASLDGLRDELLVAASPARPTAAAAQPVWDFYDDLYARAARVSAALNGNPPAEISVPVAGGNPADQAFPMAVVHTHLSGGRDINAVSAKKARYGVFAFDVFESHWRGHRRRDEGSQIVVSNCRDRQGRATNALNNAAHLLGQEWLAGDDSALYVSGAQGDCLTIAQVRQDRPEYGYSLINTQTGVILGAIGLRAQARNGIRAIKPRIGFYVDWRTLVWFTEESRENDISHFAVTHEQVGGDAAGNATLTVLTVRLRWNRGNDSLVAGSVVTEAEQYRGQPVDAARDRTFWLRQVTTDHGRDNRYQRRFERMTIADAEAYAQATAAGPMRDYLDTMVIHVRKRTALEDAPLGDRDSITFIMGPTADSFFGAATEYFRINPTTTVLPFNTPGQGSIQTLSDMRNRLVNNPPANLPWGQINIVSHANPDGFLNVRLDLADLDDFTTAPDLNNNPFNTIPDRLLDVRSDLYIRGCQIGDSAPFLQAFSEAIGRDDNNDWQQAPTRAPRLLQHYDFKSYTRGADRWDVVDQNLTSEWMVRHRESAGNAQIEARFAAVHGANYPHIDFNGAVGRTTARYPGDFFEFRFRNLTLTARELTANLPAGNRNNSAQIRAYITAHLPGVVAWLAGFGMTVDLADWTAPVDGADTVFTGSYQQVMVWSDVLADLADVFVLPSAEAAHLQARTLTETVRAAFEASGHPLSDHVDVLRYWTGARWIIKDWGNRRVFQISIRPAHLQVQLETPRPVQGANVVGAAQHLASVNRTQPVVLFHVGTGAAGQLGNGRANNALRQGFAALNFGLSDSYFVHILRAGQRWALYDNNNGRNYLLMRAGNRINVHHYPAVAHPTGSDPAFFGIHTAVNLNSNPPGQNVAAP